MKDWLKFILIVLGIYFLYLLREIAVLFFLGIVFSGAFLPVVDYLEKRKVPRAISTLFLFFLIIVLFSFVIFKFIPIFIGELKNVTSELPQKLKKLVEWFPQIKDKKIPILNLTLSELFSQISQKVTSALIELLSSFLKSITHFLDLFLFLVFTFYLTVEKNFSQKFAEIFPKSFREKIKIFFEETQKVGGSWVQGYFILSLFVFFFLFLGLSLIKLKYAFFLALLGGIFEILPMIGPTIAGAVGISLALFQGGLVKALLAFLVYFLVQQIENYLLVPYVMREKVKLDPLMTILALAVGGSLGGVLGLVISVPLLASYLEIKKKINF